MILAPRFPKPGLLAPVPEFLCRGSHAAQAKMIFDAEGQPYA